VQVVAVVLFGDLVVSPDAAAQRIHNSPSEVGFSLVFLSI
jgi:hypothetical protein